MGWFGGTIIFGNIHINHNILNYLEPVKVLYFFSLGPLQKAKVEIPGKTRVIIWVPGNYVYIYISHVCFFWYLIFRSFWQTPVVKINARSMHVCLLYKKLKVRRWAVRFGFTLDDINLSASTPYGRTWGHYKVMMVWLQQLHNIYI